MISLLYPCICFDMGVLSGPGGGGSGGAAADTGGSGGSSIVTREESFINPSITPCDFNSISPGCEAAANLSSILGSYANFISNVQNGYNQGGCQWFLSRIAHWQNQLATINYGPGMIARKQAKIDYCNCMYNTCCASPIIYGCMDDGNMPNTYQNNQGGLGSVLPPSTANPNGVAAINYYPAATQDNGTCIYPDPAKGCNDPLANNYMNPANYPPTTSFLDCDPNTANVMGSAAYLASGPYGDTSCCTYDPPAPPGVKYNYRFWRGNGVTDIGAMGLFGYEFPYGHYPNPITMHEIGHPYMSFKFNKLTAVLNYIGVAAWNITNLYLSWSQILQMYPFVSSSTMHGNHVLISVWDKHEVLLGQWKYAFTGGGNTCGAYGTCHTMPRLEFISHVAGPSILDIPDDAYIKIEHESGLYGNDPTYFADSADLSNYANTGTNIRMINPTTGAPISGNPGYWYICVSHCGGYADGCHKWKASLPPPVGSYLGPLDPSSSCCGGSSLKLLNPNIENFLAVCPEVFKEIIPIEVDKSKIITGLNQYKGNKEE